MHGLRSDIAQSSRPLRVLHCPRNLGGHAQGLAAAERELGLDSRLVEFCPGPFGFKVDERLWAESDSRWTRERKRWRFIRRVLSEYDVVHFNYGQTMLPSRWPMNTPEINHFSPLSRLFYALYAFVFEQRDLAWLKRRGIGIVMTYQGDDARQGDVCRSRFAVSTADDVPAEYYSAAGDRCKRRRIAQVSKFVDQIFALNPDLLHVLPPGSRFLPYANLDPKTWGLPPAPLSHGGRPVVLHAPTHRGVKGTRFVLEAVRRLREIDRIDFEFQLIENVPHTEARELYCRADLLVDQLLVGWYGGLALELMALGRPVISYLREADRQFVPTALGNELPVISATPDSVYDVLKQWLTVRRDKLPQRGAEARRFVERWHDPLCVAGQTAAVYHRITGRSMAGLRKAA